MTNNENLFFAVFFFLVLPFICYFMQQDYDRRDNAIEDCYKQGLEARQINNRIYCIGGDE